jgi:hypothetical protein
MNKNFSFQSTDLPKYGWSQVPKKSSVRQKVATPPYVCKTSRPLLPLIRKQIEGRARGGQKDDFRPLTSTLGEGGHGVQGQICHILTPVSYSSLPAPSGHRFPHFGYIHLKGRGGGGGALILDRCRAFNLFASVDAHLWVEHTSLQIDHPPNE